MSNMPNPPNEQEQKPDEDPGGPPTEVSKPVGDAFPTPVEPGLDQPLPEKGETPPHDDEAKHNPLGETETPPGVPPPGPSDFA
ncbi:hypothetical protein J2797_000413 [Paraburkholderia terricola]|uniref:hypothetical protein n=1 Tax=Paraburkholderia terricola TaxID=169427 RepID=UPI00285A947A|nr:hypothetical protein [Paraburkholderia terricola]MDR6490537.1 hypothetical protein [Paraburkholderia terricola]